MNGIPRLQTPREAAAAAVAALEYGARADDVATFLAAHSVPVDFRATGCSATAAVRLSSRRHAEATAGCRADALTHALRDLLGTEVGS